MKRLGFIYNKIYDRKNLITAYEKAKSGKGYYAEVKEFEKDLDNNIDALQQMLINKTYHTSKYIKFIKDDGAKQRVIYKLPFYPDRIVHWAIMLQIEDMFIKNLIIDTYSAIPKRGMKMGKDRIEHDMRAHPEETKYCYKFDIKHYYQCINHEILLSLLSTKIKDPDLMWLLSEIVGSISTAEPEDLEFLYPEGIDRDKNTGIPIGNYLSQYFGNFYLSALDHYCKEKLSAKYYYRYMDDIIILAPDKQTLHNIKNAINIFLWDKLKLKVKPNYQIFSVAARGIDCLGYRIFHTHTLVRKSIKKNIVVKTSLAKKKMTVHNGRSIISLWGWTRGTNSYRLIKKYYKRIEYQYNLLRRKMYSHRLINKISNKILPPIERQMEYYGHVPVNR